jgi:N-acetyl-alpha-D-muramate 1-phosphate uridylyltransferase
MSPPQQPKTAMVFAAGLGLRMRPLTETLPKPLIKVAGKALIDHCLDRLAEAGVERAVVNVHYLADQIEAHLKGRRSPEIIISDEREKLLDQGGGVKRALPWLGGAPFLICNTDAFWLEGPHSNLARLAADWDSREMDVSLLVAPTVSAAGLDWPGDFAMSPDGWLSRRKEREVAPYVYSGVGMIKPELFANQRENIFRLAPLFFEAAEKRRLRGVRLDGVWIHVGHPDAIAEAERAIDRSIL